MAIKKKVNGTWQPISPKQLKGIPYTGTLPAVITGTKAGYLHRYKVYGNVEQTGTPTPSDPIYPSECGERTENIIDDYLEQAYIGLSAQGVVSSYSSIDLALFPIEQGLTYTIQRFVSYIELYVGFFVSKPQIGSVTYDQTIHAPSPAASSTFTFVAPITGWAAVRSTRAVSPKATVCVVEGSTPPKSYIPYGYKLPLTSAGQNVDIYLGAEPLRKIGDYADYIDYDTGKIVRQVGKIKLTGSENINKNSGSATNYLYYTPRSTLTDSISKTPIVCDRLQAAGSPPSAQIGINTINNYNMVYFNFGADVMNAQPSGNTINGLKEYLAAQYTTGTPVTIWYVLVTPVEEDPPVPFPQIPTSANSTTISWGGSGLAPSQFDSIQEWVDIPTYKRVNGAWVADN